VGCEGEEGRGIWKWTRSVPAFPFPPRGASAASSSPDLPQQTSSQPHSCRLLLAVVTMSSTAEVFAAMKEAVAGDGGKALQRKFKVGPDVVVVSASKTSLSHVRQRHGKHLFSFDTAHPCNQGTATFTVGDKLYSLDLSSPSSCDVSEGDAFDGKADLLLTCTEEVMGKMIRKEVQPQQGEWHP